MPSLRLFLPKHIAFMAYRKHFSYTSVGMVVFAIILILFRGLNFGVDFRGGVAIEAQSNGVIPIADLRKALSEAELGDIVIQEFGSPDTVLIRTELVKNNKNNDAIGDVPAAQVVEKITLALRDFDSRIVIQRTATVGPKVSQELLFKGILAMIASLSAIAVYIWFRFEWQFALAALLTLFHDIVLTIGIFSLFQMEFTLTIVAAILTLTGYSLNDTIVIFDRIREYVRLYRKKELDIIIDESINATLSRTLQTAITTLLALFALYLFGGTALQGFSFALIWGVVIGTYSSVYVAGALLAMLPNPREGLLLDTKKDVNTNKTVI